MGKKKTPWQNYSWTKAAILSACSKAVIPKADRTGQLNLLYNKYIKYTWTQEKAKYGLS